MRCVSSYAAREGQARNMRRRFLRVLPSPRTVITFLKNTIASPHSSPPTSFPEHPAVLRGSILVTWGGVALAILILLLGHSPPPPPTTLPAAMQEWQAVRAADEAWLHSYGWIDPEQQRVHIPIREAMRLFVAQNAHQNAYDAVEEGRALFMGEAPIRHKNFRGCRTCHYLDPSRGVLVGPNLAGIADRAATRQPGLTAPEYIRQSIVHHDAFVVEGFERGLMRSIVGNDFGEMLTDRDIDNLVAYLMTLREPSPTSTAVSPSPLPTPFVGQPLIAVTPGPMLPGDLGLRLFAATADHATVGYPRTEGFSFTPATGWLASEVDGVVVARPREATYQNGPLVAMRIGSIENLNIPNVRTKALTTTESLFAALAACIGRETYGMTLTDAVSVTIGGYPGYVASLSGWGMGDVETDIAGRLALALVDTKTVSPTLLAFLMIGLATPTERWTIDHQFTQLLQSVRFGDDHGTDSGFLHLPPPRVVVPRVPEPDRQHGPRFGCVHCHITHNVTMRHKSNPSCASCHSGTAYQRHCVDCHSIHGVAISHRPYNPSCLHCHVQGIPGDGVDFQRMLVTFLGYLFHDI